MNMRIFQLFLTMSMFLSGIAMAAPPSVTIGNGAGQVGSIVPVDIDMNFNADSTVALIQFDVTYDNTELTLDSLICDSILISPSPLELINITCSEVVLGTIRVLANNTLLNPIGDTLLGTIRFSIASAAVNVYPLVVSGEVYGDSASQPVASGGSDDGSVTVTLGPQPDWSSVPDSATGFDFGSHTTDTGAYPLDLTVTNAGADGSTLTGDCAVAGSAVFSISGDNTLGSGLAANASTAITVQCDTTSALVQLHTGIMTCTHNGDGTTEISPTDYDLACNVTATPEPAFLGVDSGLNAMTVAEQGDPDATATLSVSNNGEVGTTLIGECVYAGAPEISVTGGVFAIAQGSAPVDVLATCSGAAEGTYAGTLTCGPTSPQTWVAADSPYAVGCTVGPPGDAVYESAPVPGSTIDMTPPGSPVLEGTVIPTQALVITNNPPEANDRDLALLTCGLSGMGPISATAPSSPLAPAASTTVTFSCDSATAGDYSETYSCAYDVDGDGTEDGTATYTVNCAVRLAESDVVLTPPDGSDLTITVAPGGTGQTSVRFLETADEGEDGSLEDCSLADETYFSIIEPVSFPAVIPSGGFLQVLIEGMAMDDGEPASTTLTCTYSDSNVTDQVVTWTVGAVTRDIPIPTLSVWGLSLMILTLLGLGGLVIRRRIVI